MGGQNSDTELKFQIRFDQSQIVSMQLQYVNVLQLQLSYVPGLPLDWEYPNFWKFKCVFLENKIQKNAKILNTFRPQWVKLGLRKSGWKMPTPLKKEKYPNFEHFRTFFSLAFMTVIILRSWSWWAPHMHKKLSGPKMESQLRNTFSQSLIVTLYISDNRFVPKQLSH